MGAVVGAATGAVVGGLGYETLDIGTFKDGAIAGAITGAIAGGLAGARNARFNKLVEESNKEFGKQLNSSQVADSDVRYHTEANDGHRWRAHVPENADYFWDGQNEIILQDQNGYPVKFNNCAVLPMMNGQAQYFCEGFSPGA